MTLPQEATFSSSSAAAKATGIRKFLLVCGILAPLLYIGADILAATRFDGYSYSSQTISELMAIGAPTRPLLIALFLPWNVLVAAFGIGVWLSARGRRAVRVAGTLLLVYSGVSLTGLLFSPMHLRGSAGSATDVMHILITVAIVLLTVLYIAFGAAGDGKWFSLYSVGTIVTMVVFGGLAGMQGPRLAANLPTPLIGVWERVSVYSSMVWMIVLAVVLLRAREAGQVEG
jgi:hypothetical protein